MPVIWGFDLSEMSWSAFGHAKMFDKRWHLRRERFVLYQLAMLICLSAECCATYSLSKYDDLHEHVHSWSEGRATVHKRDTIQASILTICFCVFVATLYGADFFFLLFFPRRLYPKWYVWTKKALAVIITAGVFAAALLSTIVIATRSAYVTGVSPEEAQQLIELYFRPPLEYKTWAVNIAWVVLIWPGFLATAASTVIMFIAADYDAANGTEPLDEKESVSRSVEDTGSP
ncbi:hypothetical protein Moror_7252 [Moniliophthora roreri MCA 2997]|uniref:Uncharacterized protein n=2 Tax=Moniliophthora roreri TaxID=221103 RepID=V2XAI2_MONRO|nr:hypothetical protein Moror_7252 [Moniliophthora roreri MCA 2997]KAI3622027.1 hypothetical protein WG66_015924 [Moniliophthora roreri]